MYHAKQSLSGSYYAFTWQIKQKILLKINDLIHILKVSFFGVNIVIFNLKLEMTMPKP